MPRRLMFADGGLFMASSPKKSDREGDPDCAGFILGAAKLPAAAICARDSPPE
jgi:hypothetical protein